MTLVENDPPLLDRPPGRRPARRGSTVRLHNFEGPFDLLLQLIGTRELDITEMALHTVTDDFIAHLAALGDDADLDETTEFLVVAATLLDLKAARLLPDAEVEDAEDLALLEARDLLFARLLQYRAYKQVAALFVELEAGRDAPVPALGGAGGAVRRAAAGGAARRGPGGVRRARRVGVPAQAAADRRARPPARRHRCRWPSTPRCCGSGSPSWARPPSPTLTADCASPLEVVARFLAVLDLYRERCVELEQPEAFGELTVRWTPSTRDRREQAP